MQIFKFFRNKLPEHDIVPQKNDPARRQGARIPAEHGPDRRHRGSLACQLQRRTNDAKRRSHRSRSPTAPRVEAPGGRWRPSPGQRYEFALVKPDAKTLHVYMEPFVRSDYDDPPARLGSDRDPDGQVPRQLRGGDDPLRGVLGQRTWPERRTACQRARAVHADPVPVGKEGERVLRVQLGRQGRKHAERRTGAEPAALHPGGAGIPAGQRHRRTRSTPIS